MIKAIETQYKGYRFRSRIEARWAVFFDSLGYKWEYEPEGYEFDDGTRYLPDFLVNEMFWFEVKGRPPEEKDLKKLSNLAHKTGKWAFISWGDMSMTNVTKDYIDGGRIISFSPSKEFDSLVIFSIDNQSYRQRDFLCGFYEDVDGEIFLDHLYENDLPITKSSTGRMVRKITVDGIGITSFNFGNGRVYKSKKIMNAFNSARSSRFEFGESGARL